MGPESTGAILVASSLLLASISFILTQNRVKERLQALKLSLPWEKEKEENKPSQWEKWRQQLPFWPSYQAYYESSRQLLSLGKKSPLLDYFLAWDPLALKSFAWLLVLSLLSGLWLGLWGIGLPFVLAVLPQLWVWQVSQARRRQLTGELTRMIDYLTILLLHGPTLRQALEEVSQKKGYLNQAIATALRHDVTGEKSGAVLQRLAHALNWPQLDSFAAALLQAETLGTPLIETLRGQARSIRRTRRQQLERRINLLPLGLTVITVLFLLPPILVVVLLPNIIGFLRSPW